MRIGVMRAIDRFVGIPLCWILGLFGRAFPQRRRKPLADIENILIMKFFGLGSVVLSTPALSILKESFPRARVGYLSFERNRALLERIPLVDEVITITTSSPIHFISDTLRAVRLVRKRGYDVVFDFEFFSKFSTLIGRLSNTPVRVGFALPARWRSQLLTHRVQLTKNRHVAQAFCEQVFMLTGKQTVPGVLAPAVYPEDEASLRQTFDLNGKPFIAVNVNAGLTFLERRWPPDKFADLISRIALTDNGDFVFIGTKDERPYVQRVIDMTVCPGRCHNLSGLLTIPELCALFQLCDLVISNDSGPLHLAAAMGARTVALFGPESPTFYGPLSDRASVVYKPVPCSPCMNVYAAKSFRCPYNARCMHAIDVAEVEIAVQQMYSTA